MASFDPSMYGVANMDDAATTAFDNENLIKYATDRAKKYLAMSALKDKTDEMKFAAQEAIDNSVSNASDAINRSNAFTSLATTGIGLLGSMDFGGSAQKTVNDFGNQASGTPGNDFYVGSGGGIFPNPGK